MLQMGEPATDWVTGFEGIITARCVYINGCIQYELEGKCDEKGALVSHWFDEGRVDQEARAKELERRALGTANDDDTEWKTGGPFPHPPPRRP